MTAEAALGTTRRWHAVPPWLRSRWAVASAFVVIGVVLSGVLPQLLAPFIRRDDWQYMLPAGTPGVTDLYARNHYEGRWVNYAYWLVLGQHSSPALAVLVLFTAYLLFVVGLWRLFATTSWVAGVLLGLALLVSPIWIRLIYWPATLGPSAVVAATGVWTLPWALARRRRLVVWVVLFTVLSVLTYPPVAALLLLSATVGLRGRSWRTVLLTLGAFVGGFALGIATIYALNWFAFGHFGVRIAQWRNPNPVESLSDLRTNAARYKRQLIALARALGPAAVIGIGAWIAGLVDARVRPALLRVLAALVVVVGLEAAQTVLTGVRTNLRGSLWAWLAVVIPAGLLLAGSAWSRRLAYVCLTALAATGLLAWRGDVGVHQETRRQYDAIVATALHAAGGGPAKPIVFYQDPAERGTTRGAITAGTFHMMFQDRGGVVPRWCRPAECAEIASRASEGPVIDLGPVTAVVVPHPPRVL